MQNLKLLTGAALSIVLFGGAIYPAVALPISEQSDTQLIGQMGMEETVTGEVKGIAGDQITLELPNGETRTIIVSQAEVNRLALKVGDRITASIGDDNVTTEVTLVTVGTTEEMTGDMTQTGQILQQRTVEQRTYQQNTVQTQPIVPQQQVAPTPTYQENYQNNQPVRALW